MTTTERRIPAGARWVSDPGHGWLVVPLDGSHEARMARAIAEASRYSWVRAGAAYLEEDCDAGAWATACCISRPELQALREVHVENMRRGA